ncbi:uncharacterized protein MYCFIDRAFT_190891 [Pseudocercospora fijiensis CIRAD86]|uniref:GH16 domain-containing protein n=1 Tax=Pseudocercospora fijiensis (strain CIRAD86) TaxID=383855 RepID=M2YLT3_PSEFD|nr:uncharacterized protein MYCFIDRAFT_190891 [Pseudocercospora fijiensis CIRAD86]EME78690.1 hypothetical protein MYCFIDRAFT_190891 [Pseudocercospora fijiensis CIRAD86]
MLFLVAFLFLVRIAAGAGRNATSSSQCSCGFRDPQTGELYTESIIMYFNETTSVDQHVLRLMDYSHKNQKGWTTTFRQGASPANVRFGNNGSLPWQDAVDGTAPRLEMVLGARRFDHLSNGAELQSLRRDILYGSFRAEMRSPSYLERGSAMSMFLQYNDTQTATIDMCNMDMPTKARVLQLINGESPSYSLATNYSLIEKGDPPRIPALSPYSFMELRIDWTDDTLDFWINNNRTRRATKKERTLPSVPQTLYFSHWSTGDQYYMQGPPVNASVAQLQWVRAFFNTSLMTKADHEKYDQRCEAITACSVDDMTLRESTEYQSAAVVKWKPSTPHQRIRDVAGYIAAAFSVFGAVSIINALIRRGPWWRIKKKLKALPGSKRHSTQALRKSLRESIGTDLANASYPGPPAGDLYGSICQPVANIKSKSQVVRLKIVKRARAQAPQLYGSGRPLNREEGLVALCCIMVTLRHFSLTFWPYVTTSGGYVMHFKADLVLSYILGPYILTPLWIGPFFVTSCRFLAQRYLKTGKLNDIANKMLLRAPRMLIPVFIFMTLEYFLISLGLTSRLEWLPSVSYSTWPYVTPQPNFGVFLNEAVEISYITPNAAPEVINHYCVGVLWTIPVQLQFSFVTLLATVLVKDVKTPWKRFSFYTFTIICGWYGQSWSACHWLGLMLADLDITYDWKKWIYARWWRHYGIITIAVVITLATPLALLFNSSVLFWSFMSWENAIHPNPTTGRPIYESLPSIWWAYPQYYEPNLAILTFSLGLQLIVELSTWTQKALSIKIVTFFHPHIMTIYLMHGFVFWSVGASVAVWLSGLSFPYWATLIITALFSYATILFFAVIMTPLIEFATKGSVKNIWRWATEEPVPHRRTTAPFTKDLVLGRMQDEGEEKKANAQVQTA